MDVLIDTDPGMGTLSADPEDDFAIMLALQSPELNVRAITTVHGNVPAANAYANAMHLLELLGRTDIPVAPGMERPLMPDRSYSHNKEQQQFGPWADMRAAHHNAVDLMIDTVCGSPGEVDIIAIAPLTNVATAILHTPRFASAVRRLVIMGGAATIPGNITPAAEFNIYADPEAAAVVFASGIPITLVGLDVCHQTRLSADALAFLREGDSPLAAFIRQSTAEWLKMRTADWGGAAFHLYDSLAIAVAFQPDLVETTSCWIDIETAGRYTSGQTVAYLSDYSKRWVGDRTNCQLCLKVDNDRFEQLFRERVLHPLQQGLLTNA